MATGTLAGIPRVVFLTKLADYGVPTFRFTRELGAGGAVALIWIIVT
jgi:hypothetical protein